MFWNLAINLSCFGVQLASATWKAAACGRKKTIQISITYSSFCHFSFGFWFSKSVEVTNFGNELSNDSGKFYENNYYIRKWIIMSRLVVIIFKCVHPHPPHLPFLFSSYFNLTFLCIRACRICLEVLQSSYLRPLWFS